MENTKKDIEDIKILTDAEIEEDASGMPSSVQLWFQEATRLPLLTPEESYRLLKQYKEGTPTESKKAMDILVASNLRLVISVAKRYSGTQGMDLLDLIQEGNIGLITAIKRFDLSKDTRLSTYAVWWIRQHIERAIANQAKTIRVPVHLSGKYYALLRKRKEFINKYQHEPTIKEWAKFADIEEAKLSTIVQQMTDVFPLDAPMPTTSGDGNDTYGSLIADENTTTPEQEALYNISRQQLWTMLEQCLKEQEVDVLKMRYGYYDNHVYTLESVGKKYGVTRERIRQIEEGALKKLRTKNKLSILKDFMLGVEDGVMNMAS